MGESSKKEKKSKKKAKDEEPKEEGGDEPKEEPNRAKRATSNVFALFNQAQIQEFKEAFTMMDQDRDGVINDADLASIYQQIGREPDSKTIKSMLDECPGQLNFTHFLTLFGEKLHGRVPTDNELTSMLSEVAGAMNFPMFLAMFGEQMRGSDPENTLRDAFAMFDPDGSGKLAEDYLKDLLSNTGDLFSKDELKQTWKNTPIEGGMIDYKQFTQIIKGKEDE